MSVCAVSPWALIVIAAAAACGLAAAQEAPTLGIIRSDVVFMYPSASYEQYGATVVAWGGRPWGSDENALKEWRQRIETARAAGVRYRGSVDFRVGFAGMIDFDPNFMDSVCRTLDGQPITIPWLWDQKHKGHPAYWFCTNSPAYRAYLRHQADLALSADMDGLHIDDYNGTAGTHWQGGCFCHWCMDAFRAYLKQNVAGGALADAGINSLDGFDYGEFLRGRGLKAEDFRRQVESYPPRLPLAQEYLTFQLAAARDCVQELRRYAEGVARHPLVLSVNSGVSGQYDLFIAPVITYFVGEVGHDAASRAVPLGPVFSYKLGDALGRPVAATAAGWDWAFVKENKTRGLVRTWIAQAYAFGHQLMAPTRQWCYTEQKGTHWYDSAPGDYDYLYRFVRQHAELLDGYDAVAQVGLLYSNAAFRRWQQQGKDACAALVARNVPFRLVLAGDDWMQDRLSDADLAGLRALVVTEPTHLDAEQQAVLEDARSRTVVWPDEKRLAALVPPLIAVEGAANVTAVPRAKAGDPRASFVCHLVNRNYGVASDSMQVQRDFTVFLAHSLFGADVASVTLHAPMKEPVELAVRQLPDGVAVAVPELDLWAILELARR